MNTESLEVWIECDVCHREFEDGVTLQDGTYICAECMNDRRI